MRARALGISLFFAVVLVVAFALANVYVDNELIRWLFFGIMLAGITVAGGTGVIVLRPLIRGSERALEEAEREKREIAREANEKVRQLEAYAHEIEQANEDLRRFANVASHDLKEPVRMISSYVGLLEKRYGDELDDEAHEYMGYAIDGAQRLNDLIDGLQSYAQIGDPELDFGVVDLDEVFDHATRNLHRQVEESGARIHKDDLPEVRGDRAQLVQVFQNLLSNAIKYSGDEPPEIHVWAERRGGEWLVSVRDHGVGFDAEREHRIFDIFQSAHAASEGHGVGLAICKRIVDRHRGEIWAEAEPGEGAEFKLTLPSPDSDVEPLERLPREPPETLEERTREVI